MSVRVSVITCHVSEREEMIREAYQSLLMQSEENWEWLIEAGETDNISDLAKDTRVRIRNNDISVNVPGKRNRALLEARGTYVACLDDDDTLPRHSLQSRADALDQNPEVAFAFGIVTNSAKEYGADPVPRGLVPPGIIYSNWQETKRSGGSGVFPAPAGVMWRPEVLWEMGGWLALPRSEDTSLLMRTSVKYPAYFVGEETYHIREHSGRMTRSSDWKEEVWQWVENATEAYRRSLS